jgi:Flp pilus assembly protein TadD
MKQVTPHPEAYPASPSTIRAATRLRRLSASVAIVLGLCAAGFATTAQADDYGDVSALIKSGKLAEALAKTDVYLTAKPKDPQMRFLKGVVLTESGKTDDAIATLAALTQEYPELPEPYNNLAALYASQNQYDKARTALEMAVKLNPAYATAHENLGDVYAKLASQSYARALQINAANPQATQKVAALRDMLAPQTKGKAAAKPAAPAQK